jgi:hypothetical protein
MKSKTIQEHILTFLVENNQDSFSIREISNKIKKDYKNTYDAVKQMPSVKITKVGSSNQVSFNFNFSTLLFGVEMQRQKRVLKDKNMQILYSDLCKINAQFILLLFGSRAKRKQTKRSDYDLLLLSDSPEKIEQKIGLYPTNIDLNVFSLDEFRQMLLSKEFTVISEAVKNNVILFGTEDYYRLIKNAK